MLASKIINSLNCQKILMINDDFMQRAYQYAFASDLMSDALVLIGDNGSQTVFLTGLCNVQTLLTAQMLDIDFIIYVRDKIPDETVVAKAKELEINLFTTQSNMFIAAGKLYQQGLKSPS